MNPQTPTPPTPLTFTKSNKTPPAATIILGVLLAAAIIFGIWAYMGRQDYKNNVDKKVATAVAAAEKTRAAQLQSQAQLAFDAVNTYEYQGPTTYGSVTFRYPKTWSGYVDGSDSSEPVNGYFQPDIVPGTQSAVAFALRVELSDKDYQSVVDQFQGDVQDGSVRASAYLPPKLKKVSGAIAGLRLDGVINQDSSGNKQTGSMVILKVRDKTLQIYTESPKYLDDFNKIILASLTYKP